jgi:predicted GNAT family N-acyltransferase
MSRFEIMVITWHSPQAVLLRTVREQVFIQEQHSSPELEWLPEMDDEQAIHLLALDIYGQAIGTVRLLPTGQISRMAVLKEWRKHGVGSALLTRIVSIAQTRMIPRIFIHAQAQAVAFYRKFSFAAVGEPFQEAGILHQEMFLSHFSV